MTALKISSWRRFTRLPFRPAAAEYSSEGSRTGRFVHRSRAVERGQAEAAEVADPAFEGAKALDPIELGRLIGLGSGDLIHRDIARPAFEAAVPARRQPARAGEDVRQM